MDETDVMPSLEVERGEPKDPYAFLRPDKSAKRKPKRRLAPMVMIAVAVGVVGVAILAWRLLKS